MASLNDIETRIRNIADILDRRVVTTITGVLPFTFRAEGSALMNYRIYGTAEGAGAQTENLINVAGFTVSANETGAAATKTIWQGTLETGTYTIVAYQETALTSNVRNTLRVNLKNESVFESGTVNYHLSLGWHTLSFTVDTAQTVGLYLWAQGLSNDCEYNRIMLVKGSTPPETFIPHGYKLPLTVTSGAESKNSDIYIGNSKLLSNDYVDYETGKIVRNGTPQDPPKPFPEIDTYIGINTLDSVETLGEVTIKGKIKEVI